MFLLFNTYDKAKKVIHSKTIKNILIITKTKIILINKIILKYMKVMLKHIF